MNYHVQLQPRQFPRNAYYWHNTSDSVRFTFCPCRLPCGFFHKCPPHYAMSMQCLGFYFLHSPLIVVTFIRDVPWKNLLWSLNYSKNFILKCTQNWYLHLPIIMRATIALFSYLNCSVCMHSSDVEWKTIKIASCLRAEYKIRTIVNKFTCYSNWVQAWKDIP